MNFIKKLIVISFILIISSASAQEKSLKIYNYKNFNIEIVSFENISYRNSFLVKYVAYVVKEDNSVNYSFLLRYVPKSDDKINFDYILFLQDNKKNNNINNSKALPKFKFKEPVLADDLENLINEFIDKDFNVETKVEFDTKLIQNRILFTSKQNIEYLINKNFKEFVKSIHPLALKELNYQQKGEEVELVFKEAGLHYVYLDGTPSISSQVINFNGELQCIVTWDVIVEIDFVKYKIPKSFVASSFDNGDHWYYTQVDSYNINNFANMVFNLGGLRIAPQFLEILQEKIKAI
ncbi:MAG: hypothetical protein ACRC8Z_08905 [Empedobacter falsenii]